MVAKEKPLRRSIQGRALKYRYRLSPQKCGVSIPKQWILVGWYDLPGECIIPDELETISMGERRQSHAELSSC